ncbi:SDR family oxidoreductase [Streptomyces sp. KL116D]|uniref:SDR family oxidoreductase n=1 Tax=Streptomyces sp. KL116D TaxID=3045152 RepID=UPI003556D0B1
MTHALAMEFSKRGIRFTAVQPGSISSGMTDGSGQRQAVGRSRPARRRHYDAVPATAPMLQVGHTATSTSRASTVAAVVAMLASHDGYFITGTEVRIDGGSHM